MFWKYWAIVPFYSEEQNLQDNILKLNDTISALVEKCWVELCCVINDSPDIDIQPFISKSDRIKVINMEQNKWKSQAVKTWIEYITNNTWIQYIIQSDFDKEQNPWDAELFQEYIETQEILPDKILLIWDRYKHRSSETWWNWWNNSYRENVLDAQSLLCSCLWIQWLQDLTSWLRMYSSELAKCFLEKWKWEWFAADLDQFIIACLEQAKVDSISLSRGKERDTYTRWAKLIQVFNWILCHREELIEKWNKWIVDLFDNIVSWLKRQDSVIEVDLNLIWKDKVYYFINNWDDKYSLIDKLAETPLKNN